MMMKVKKIISVGLMIILLFAKAPGYADAKERLWVGTAGGVAAITPDGEFSPRPEFGENADGTRSEEISLTPFKEYELLEMPFVRLLIGIAAAVVFILGVATLISLRKKLADKQSAEQKAMAAQIMSVAARMADYRDEWSNGHSDRVAAYSQLIGRRLGIDDGEFERLYYSALLHDIGKTAVPDDVLYKKGTLTEEEYEKLKKHVLICGELLGDITIMGDIASGAKYHNERIDGKGFPEGLKGDEIPFIARIISVCNAFDSMLSDQPYRKALPIERVQSEFIRNAGTQFDARVTAVLISLIDEGEIPFKY